MLSSHSNLTLYANSHNVCRAFAGVATMQVAGIKAFVKTPTDANRLECTLFSKPLLSCVDAIVEFVESRNLRGRYGMVCYSMLLYGMVWYSIV